MYHVCVTVAIACTILFLFALGCIAYGLVQFWWLLLPTVVVGALDAFVLYGYKGRNEQEVDIIRKMCRVLTAAICALALACVLMACHRGNVHMLHGTVIGHNLIMTEDGNVWEYVTEMPVYSHVSVYFDGEITPSTEIINVEIEQEK